jgi:cell division protein FtsQ
MAIKINIRKIVSTMIWGCIGAGVLVLLVAAIRYRNNNTCKGYVISLTGSSISKKEILTLLTPAGAPKIQDRAVQSFDLHRLETTLEKNVWVQKTRLFFDNNNVLHIEVIERTPVTRVFTEDGNSFYLDSNGVRLPVLSQLPVRLPVFTGYPSPKPGRRGIDSAHREADSVLDAGVKQISSFLRLDPYWMAQVTQINIANRSFELEPESGPRVSLGDGNDVAVKFHRLRLFYQQVLSRVGLERYDRIDVSYAGQVVATRKGSEQRRYDSLQGLNNIRQLIRSAQQLQPDTLRRQSVRPLESNTMTEQNLSTHDLLPADSPATHKPKP